MLQTFTSTGKWYFSPKVHYHTTEENKPKRTGEKPMETKEKNYIFNTERIVSLRRLQDISRTEGQFLKSTLKNFLFWRGLSEYKYTDNAEHASKGLFCNKGGCLRFITHSCAHLSEQKLGLFIFWFFLIMSSRQPGNNNTYCSVPWQASEFTVQGKHSSSIKNTQKNLE